jgi:hypothetical protein
MEVEDTVQAYSRCCTRLGREFGQRGGPHFEETSDLMRWKTLKFQLGTYQELQRVFGSDTLKDPELRDAFLRTVIGYVDMSADNAKRRLDAACADLASEFQRPSGPAGVPAGLEIDWIAERAKLRIFRDLNEKLFDIREALGLPAEAA